MCNRTRVRANVTLSGVRVTVLVVKIGYGRVSTRGDQNPAAQHDALTAAGCDQVYVDNASGALASGLGLSGRCCRPTAPTTSSWSPSSTGSVAPSST